MYSMMKVTVTVLFLAVLLNVYVHPAPTPGHESDFLQEWKNDDNPCVHDGGRMEICQRCAKQSKSSIAYPMCCNDIENALDWCNKFINYGSFP